VTSAHPLVAYLCRHRLKAGLLSAKVPSHARFYPIVPERVSIRSCRWLRLAHAGRRTKEDGNRGTRPPRQPSHDSSEVGFPQRTMRSAGRWVHFRYFSTPSGRGTCAHAWPRRTSKTQRRARVASPPLFAMRSAVPPRRRGRTLRNAIRGYRHHGRHRSPPTNTSAARRWSIQP
jgi:hypothetical protein